MCGACGSAPVGHWSAPFLATLPARSSAARAVAVIVARAGSRVAVSAVAGGYAVTTPTGQGVVAADLGEVCSHLRRLRVLGDAVPPAPTIASAGPATVPRLGASAPGSAGPSLRLHRFPVLLAWLAALDGHGPRLLRLGLGLDREVAAAIEVVDGTVVRCAPVPAVDGGLDALVEVDDPDGRFMEPLKALVEPWTAARSEYARS